MYHLKKIIEVLNALLLNKKNLKFISRVCLSASVKKEHMNAYLRVTDEVLHQIRIIELPSRDIDPEKVDNIKDAIEILDRINRRDLYRLVGENKITWRDQSDREVHYNSHIYTLAMSS